VRRSIAFVALWFLAGAAATTVAWLGVSTVSDQLAGSGSHPDPLSADEIAAEVEGASTTTVASLDTTTSTSTTSTTAPQVTTTTRSSPPATSSPPSSTTTAAPQPVVRSYDLVGGSATLQFSSSGVTVVVASPKAGFTVDIGSSHDGGKRVEFESTDHLSRLDAWWDGGPQDEVREDD
jgi:hypothetical protein